MHFSNYVFFFCFLKISFTPVGIFHILVHGVDPILPLRFRLFVTLEKEKGGKETIT